MQNNMSIDQPKSLSHLITNKDTLTIPFFQRRYSWNEDNCENLVQGIIDSYEEQIRFYIGNIFLNETDTSKYEIYDGQQRIVSLSLLKIAVNYLLLKDLESNQSSAEDNSNIKPTDDLTKSTLKNEINTVCNKKFVICNGDKADFDAFVKYVYKLLDKLEKSKSNVKQSEILSEQETNENSNNKFKKNFKKLLNLVSEQIEEKISLDEFNEILESHILYIGIIVKEQNNSVGIEAFKLFDSLNSTGKPLTNYDILHSHMHHAKSNDGVLKGEMIKKWNKFRELFEEKNVTNPASELFIKNYFKYLGYSGVPFEKEFESLKEKNCSLNEEDTLLPYNILIENMNYVYNFINLCTVKYKDLVDENIKCCFKENDQRIDHKKCKHFKYYLDGIFLTKSNHSDVAIKVYLRYLDNSLTFDDLFKCLRVLWCASLRTFIIRYYGATAKRKSSLLDKVITSKLEIRKNDEPSDIFTPKFEKSCEYYYNVLKNALPNINSDEDLIHFLVYQNKEILDLQVAKYLKGTQFTDIFEYFLHLIKYFNDDAGDLYKRSPACKKYLEEVENIKVLRVGDIGNIYLEDNELEPPLELTEENLRKRSEKLLNQIFKLTKFSN